MPDGSLMLLPGSGEPAPIVLAPIAPAGNRVVGCPNPFNFVKVDRQVAAGGTIADMLDAAGVDPILMFYGRVCLCDPAMLGEPMFVPRERWNRVKPKPGMTIIVRAVPTGGGGGGGGKSPMRMILSLAVIAASAWIGGLAGAWALEAGYSAFAAKVIGGVAGGFTSLVGNALVNAIAPAAAPRAEEMAFRAGGGGMEPSSPTFTITGVANRAKPYGVFSVVHGRCRYYPELGAETVTELRGNDQYFRVLLTSLGPMKWSGWKIGETPIENFEGVEIETREGWDDDAPLTLFSNDIHEEPLSVQLTAEGSWQTFTTQAAIEEISLDVAFPRGLTRITGQSSRTEHTVAFQVELRAVGAGAWSLPSAMSHFEGIEGDGTLTVTDNSTSAVRRGARIVVPQGQYDVRMRRSTADSTDNSVIDLSYWAALRSVRYVDPIAIPGVAKAALLIKASEQFSGVIDQINVVGERYYRVYSEVTGSWSWQLSRNPAWVYNDVLTAAGPNKRTVADARVNLDSSILPWAAGCDVADQDGEPTFTFDQVYDTESTVGRVLADIAAAGRARAGMPEGRHGVVRDVAQIVPVAHITPRNSWGFKGRKRFVQQPHALKVMMNDPDTLQRVEIFAYADGYDENSALTFETLETVGCRRFSQAWREGRFRLAEGTGRPESWEVMQDIEAISYGEGDFVRLTHDANLVGVASARILSVTLDPQQRVDTMTLDEVVTMEAGKSYGVRILRVVNGVDEDEDPAVLGEVARGCDTVPGETRTLTFPVPIANPNRPEAGDLVLFGEAERESLEAIVDRIEPRDELTASIKLQPAAFDIHSAGSGPLPVFDPVVTKPPANRRKPDAPAVDGVESGEAVLVPLAGGGWQARILVSLQGRLPGAFRLDHLAVQYRRSDEVAWRALPPLDPATTSVAIAEVQELVAYQVRLRVVTDAGLASDWTMFTETVIGQSTPPPDVASATIENGVLRWPYPAPPRDHWGFQVRYHFGVRQEWSNAVPAHDEAVLAAPLLPMATLPAGQLTLLIKAVDRGGFESLNAAVVVVNLGDPVTANVVETIDFAALSWPGQLTGGSESGGELVADDTGGTFWKGDAQKFWTGADATTFWTNDYFAMTYIAEVTPTVDQVPSVLSLLYDVESDGFSIDYRPDGVDLMWGSDSDDFWSGDDDAPFWADPPPWIPWPGTVAIDNTAVRSIRVTTQPGATQGTISSLTAILDVPDVSEVLEDVTIADAGTRLAIAATYRVIKHVNLTLHDDAGDAVSAQILDKDPDLGPLIKCFDGSHTAVAGTVTATVQGY